MLEEFAALGVNEVVINAGARTAEDMVLRLKGLTEELLPTAHRL